jgi:hypothetical protein
LSRASVPRFLVERHGRRTLLVTSSAGQALSLAVLALALLQLRDPADDDGDDDDGDDDDGGASDDASGRVRRALTAAAANDSDDDSGAAFVAVGARRSRSFRWRLCVTPSNSSARVMVTPLDS